MLTEANTSKFKPTQAVMVYHKLSQFYLETHDIIETEKGYCWAEGKPFAKEQLAELGMALGDQTFTPLEIKGLVPDTILSFKQTFLNVKLAWWMPPSKRTLYFAKDLKLNNTEYNLPGLVFYVNDKSLYVYAVKGVKKPTLKTKLFKGPFHNTSVDGSVCLGTAGDAKPKKILQEEMARWERRFFASRFTHGGGSNLGKGFNLQLVLANATKQKFNEAALATSSIKSVEQLLKKFNSND